MAKMFWDETTVCERESQRERDRETEIGERDGREEVVTDGHGVVLMMMLLLSCFERMQRKEFVGPVQDGNVPEWKTVD